MTSKLSDDTRFSIVPNTLKPLKTVRIKTGVIGLYSKANAKGSIETQLLYGHSFDVYTEKRGWLWGQARSPVQGSKVAGYVGWIKARSTESYTTPSHIVIGLKAPVFSRPNIKHPINLILPLGAHVTVTQSEGDFHQTSLGYVHARHLRAPETPSVFDDFVAIAEQHMGLPYIWGGISSDGLDCSGLVLSSLRATGVDALRDADVQEKSLGERISNDKNLRRSDLIFWPGHVGIMQDDTNMIHANAHHMCVASEPLKQAVARIGPIRTIKRLS